MAHEIEEGADGLYTICVFNSESCSDDEIHEIFGRFGVIVKLNRSTNATFLRYQTLEEATNCFNSMQGDVRFNVKPGRKKGPSSNSGRSRDARFGEMNRNDNPRGKRTDTGGGGDFGRTSSASNSRQTLPKLIPFPSVSTEEKASQPKQTAKLVVIGHLHPKMGQNNVYELCTKSQAPPLHVAMKTIKRPPYPPMSYAFVYVRNDKDVNNIVTSLNNLKLNGHKLVVSSVEKLAEEGFSMLKAK